MRYACVMFDGSSVTLDMLPHRAFYRRPPATTAAAADGTEPPPQARVDGSGDGALPEWLAAMTLAEVEKHVIESTVARMHGNVPQAAAHLGVAPSTLYRKRISWNPALAREAAAAGIGLNPGLPGHQSRGHRPEPLE